MGNKSINSYVFVFSSYHSIIAPRSHDNATKHMERHASKNNAPETIKVPLQYSNDWKTVFAYLRRSTTKKEQASSLSQQEDGIWILANSLRIPLESIVCYSESKSAYEDRTRAEWKKMLIDIDKLKVPCTILCRDTSRLSRNPEDNWNIRTRLFGKRWQKDKPKIENIYFLSETLVTQNWNMLSDREDVETVLHNNYMESLRTGKKSATGVLLKLNNKELPYASPKGVFRVTKSNEEIYKKNLHEWEETILIQNEKMPFIKRVFEMKVEWNTAKEISKYLKQYGKINIVPRKIVETIIQNTIYKWEYTHKQTGEVFTLNFKEWQPPIDRMLWDRANALIGKRGNGFWLGQEDHIAKGKLKYETWKSLYMYKAKGKYNAYQTEIQGENGERKTIGVMESVIVKGFLAEVVPKIKSAYYILSHWVDSRNAMAQLENMTDNEKVERVKYVNDCYGTLYQRTWMESANIIFKNFDDLLNHLRQLQNSVIDMSFELGMSDIDMNRIGRALDILYKTIPKNDPTPIP